MESTHPKNRCSKEKGEKFAIGRALFAHAAGGWEDVTDIPAAHISYLLALGDRYNSSCHTSTCISRVYPRHLHLCRFAHISCSSPASSHLSSHTHSPPAIISLAATFRFFDPKCSFDPCQHKSNKLD